jgi:outer membrane protein assembly factor BamB
MDAAADIISGTVLDAGNSLPIEFVRVVADSLHSTDTGPDGKFTLNTQGASTRISHFPGAASRAYRVRNDSRTESFLWRDPAGRVPGSEAKATGYFFRWNAEGTLSTPSMGLRNGRAGFAKASATGAANVLTFGKAGFFKVMKTVDGSASDVTVRLEAAPVDTTIGLHPFLYAGEYQRKSMLEQNMYLVRDGKIAWTYTMPGPAEYGDASLLSDGNIIFSRGEMGAALLTRDKKILWTFQTRGGGAQVHTAQPLGLDRVFLIENGNPPRAMIWNTKTNVKEWGMDLPCGNPTGFHSQFRHGRILKNGHILLAHMDMGKVSEYDTASKKETWTCPAPSAWAVVRLKNGYTLVSGNGNGWVRELAPSCKTVWEVNRNDLPGITLGTVQECSRLRNGNTLICSWNGGGTGGAQVIEVTPEKRMVWATRAWKAPDLGPASSLQVLDEPGLMENGDFQR